MRKLTLITMERSGRPEEDGNVGGDPGGARPANGKKRTARRNHGVPGRFFWRRGRGAASTAGAAKSGSLPASLGSRRRLLRSDLCVFANGDGLGGEEQAAVISQGPLVPVGTTNRD